MSYEFGVEQLSEAWEDFEPLFRQHYSEMQKRLKADGMEIPPYKPNVEAYKALNKSGDLLFFTIRCDGEPAGHASIYVTNDMHNGELIAREDTIYVLPEHRNGVGRMLSKRILQALREAGVKRLAVTALTDLRVAKLWQRMGFKHTAHHMTYFF